MFASSVWPRQTMPVLLFGAITSSVGLTVLVYAVHAGQTNLVYGMMALSGTGVGLRLSPGTLHGLAFFPHRIATISCIVSFAIPFGGTVTLTLMSTVFNNKGGGSSDVNEVRDAIMWAFISVLPFMWISVILSTFLGNVWIGKDNTHEVVHSPYLWSLLLGKKLVREKITAGDDNHFSQPNNTAKDEENVLAEATIPSQKNGFIPLSDNIPRESRPEHTT